MLPFDFVNFTGWLSGLAQPAFFRSPGTPACGEVADRGRSTGEAKLAIHGWTAKERRKDMPLGAQLPPARPRLSKVTLPPSSLQAEDQAFTIRASGGHLRWRP